MVGRGKVEPVLFLEPKAPAYRSRLPFATMMTTAFANNFPRLMDEAFASAMATARH